jgi:phosphinothricin acetyltransferase
LLQFLIEASKQNGVWTLQASIFPENLSSLGLVKKCGFREIGRREGPAQLDAKLRDVILLERRSRTVGA